MKNKFAGALMIGALLSTSAFAQAPAEQPMAASAEPLAMSEARLAAKSEVILTINEEVNSKSHKLGDRFFLTVAQDVKTDGHVVIPRGTRAVGQVISRSGKGSFGKAGKMELAFRYLDMDGQRVPLEGMHRQEGNSATAATIGAVLAAGVVGGLFVKGKSARVADGREFTARTMDAIPVVLPAGGEVAAIAPTYQPSPVVTEVDSKKKKKKKS